MSIFTHCLTVLGLAILLAIPLNGPVEPAHANASTLCFDDWSEAGPVARAQRLMPVSDVLKAVRQGRDGRVARVQLCARADNYFYRVSFFANRGTVSWLRVDARSGQIQPLARP